MPDSGELLVELERVRRAADHIIDERSQLELRRYADDLGKEVLAARRSEQRPTLI